eukprot:6594469-Ditylum_brightwellii.AAC.1
MDDPKLGDGTGFHPLKIIIIEVSNINGTSGDCGAGGEKVGNKVMMSGEKKCGSTATSSLSPSAVMDEADT